MKKTLIRLTAVVLTVVVSFGQSQVAMALTDTGTQALAVTVEEIAQLSASAAPGTQTLSNAGTTAGSLPSAVTDTTTSLSWTSNAAGVTTRKITAALSAAYTTGIVLKATLPATCSSGSTNGTSAGQKTLGTTAVDMLTGITNENCSAATVTYDTSITSMIAPVTAESKTVTWTITAAV